MTPVYYLDETYIHSAGPKHLPHLKNYLWWFVYKVYTTKLFFLCVKIISLYTMFVKDTSNTFHTLLSGYKFEQLLILYFSIKINN